MEGPPLVVLGVGAGQRHPPDAERFMAMRAEAVAVSVDGSHAAFIAQPDVAAGLILEAVAAA